MNRKYSKRLSAVINFTVNYLIKLLFWPCCVLTALLATGVSFVAYFTMYTFQGSILLVIWVVMHWGSIYMLYAIVLIGFNAFTLSVFYVKYMFNQINTKIKFSLNLKANNVVMNAIRDHNSIAKATKNFNRVFSISKAKLFEHFFSNYTFILIIILTKLLPQQKKYYPLKKLATYIFEQGYVMKFFQGRSRG